MSGFFINKGKLNLGRTRLGMPLPDGVSGAPSPNQSYPKYVYQAPATDINECSLCSNIIRLAELPLEEAEYHFNAGKLAGVQKSPCKAHRAITAESRFSAEWEKIDLSKEAMERSVRVGLEYDTVLTLALLPAGEGSESLPGSGRRVDPSWIDVKVVQSWRTMCDRNHRICQKKTAFGRGSTIGRPYLLIDVEHMCLSRAYDTDTYIALSYVWGQSNQLKASKENIQSLMEKKSLSRPDCFTKMPQTIRDAIGLVRALGERYLWADMLCIIQDDEAFKSAQINAMASIYANAALTIVAAQGHNADHSLLGLPGVSKARSYPQKVFHLEQGYTFVHCPHSLVSGSTWTTRGWTYQESLLSTRKLIFCGDTVEWQCRCAIWREDLEPQDVNMPIYTQRSHNLKSEADEHLLLRSTWPRINLYSELVTHYSKKCLTYAEDVLPAFTGLSSALTSTFDGGFLFGIPEMFFDVGLLWTGSEQLRPRAQPCPDDTAGILALPTWSWMGWTGGIHSGCWNSAWDYWKKTVSHDKPYTSKRTIPLMQWYCHQHPNSGRRPIRSN